ncbi:hypothetical protein BDN67DRAFT_1004424 [Paxillus ammoniavirescens]|nr:hypothetical protein BDN67DRAFT_1004424 [Paxillus ammoniavirescens]
MLGFSSDINRGCVSPVSRKRHIEYYLEVLPDGGDWNGFCATTPNREFGFLGCMPHIVTNMGKERTGFGKSMTWTVSEVVPIPVYVTRLTLDLRAEDGTMPPSENDATWQIPVSPG